MTRLPLELERTIEMYQEHGLVAIPLRPGSKKPAFPWKHLIGQPFSPALADRIREEFARAVGQFGSRVGIGVLCTERFWVLDVDDMQKFIKWCQANGYVLGEHTMVRTRKGLHVYMVAPAPLEELRFSRSDRIADTGAELRGFGHYVVAPYSVVEGVQYTFLQGYELRRCGLRPAPDWVVAEYVEHKQAACTPRPDVVPQLVPLVAPYWTEGERHMIALGLAGFLRKLGVSEVEALRCVQGVAMAAGDPELLDRIRAVRDTYAKPEAETVAGAALLLQHLPGDVVEAIERLYSPQPHETKPKVRLLEFPEWVQRTKERSQGAWLVEGVLREGDIMIVGGRPKVGKSIMVASLAHALGTGTTWLGRKVEHCCVLYLDYERERETTSRLELMGGDPKIFGVEERITDPETLRQAIEEARRVGLPVVVVMDTLIDYLNPTLFRSRASENAYSVITNALQQLRELATSLGASFVVVHHTAKGEGMGDEQELLGSTAISAKPDVVALVYRDKEDEEVRRLSIMGNAVEKETLYFRIGDNFTLELCDSPARTKVKAAAREVRKLLEQEGELSRGQIEQHLMAVGLATKEEAVRSLFRRVAEELGLVKRRNGKETLYRLGTGGVLGTGDVGHIGQAL